MFNMPGFWEPGLGMGGAYQSRWDYRIKTKEEGCVGDSERWVEGKSPMQR